MAFAPYRSRLLAAAIAAFLFLALPGWAAPGGAAKPAATKERGPVPVPPPSEDALNYYLTGNIAWAVQTAWELAIPAIFLFSGWAAKLGRSASRLTCHRVPQAGLCWIVFASIGGLACLPVWFFRFYMRSHWFGLSDQPLPDWLMETAKSFGVELGLGLIFICGGLPLIRRFPRNWWLAGGALALPLVIGLAFLEPMVFEPLFNDFQPIQDKALEAKVLDLAAAAGLDHPVVFQVNKSKQTKALNAYVSGVFGSSRIVLWDTLFPKMFQAEILSVVAHEMGHRVLHHVLKGTIFGWALLVAGLWGCQKSAGLVLARWGARFQIASLAEPAAIPLLVFLLLAAQFALTPVALAYSRHIEAEADRFALELTRDNHSGATSQVKLSLQNLANPRPGWLYIIFRASHPADAERIEFFNTYKPWETGQTLRYADIIRAPK
jgi:Zn-dependent protease with chaperone function